MGEDAETRRWETPGQVGRWGDPHLPKKRQPVRILILLGCIHFFRSEKTSGAVRTRQESVRYDSEPSEGGQPLARLPGAGEDAETRRRGDAEKNRRRGRLGAGGYIPLSRVSQYQTLYLLKIMMVSGCTKLHQAPGCTILNGLWNLS